MKQVRNQPITGTKVEKSTKKPFVPDAKETSANVQTMIAEPPAPFKNKLAAAQVPAPANAKGSVERKPQNGIKRSGVPVMAHLAKPARKSGNPAPGFKSKRHARFYGEG
jgi:hypothetical protein